MQMLVMKVDIISAQYYARWVSVLSRVCVLLRAIFAIIALVLYIQLSITTGTSIFLASDQYLVNFALYVNLLGTLWYVLFIGSSQILFLRVIKRKKNEERKNPADSKSTNSELAIVNRVTKQILSQTKQTALIASVSLAALIVMILGTKIFSHSISISFTTWCSTVLLSVYQVQDYEAIHAKKLKKAKPQEQVHSKTVFKGMEIKEEAEDAPTDTIFKGMEPTEDFMLENGPTSTIFKGMDGETAGPSSMPQKSTKAFQLSKKKT